MVRTYSQIGNCGHVVGNCCRLGTWWFRGLWNVEAPKLFGVCGRISLASPLRPIRQYVARLTVGIKWLLEGKGNAGVAVLNSLPNAVTLAWLVTGCGTREWGT